MISFLAQRLLFALLLFANWARMPLRHRLPIGLGFISPVIAVAGVWYVPPILLWALWTQLQYDTGTFDGGLEPGTDEVNPAADKPGLGTLKGHGAFTMK